MVLLPLSQEETRVRRLVVAHTLPDQEAVRKTPDYKEVSVDLR